MRSIINRVRGSRQLFFIVASLALSAGAHAQDRDKYDSIAVKYKNQDAVYTNITERLVIERGEDDTDLVAHSYVTMEKLLISDLSLNRFNRDYFNYSDFHQLTDYSAVASIPEGKFDYKQVRCNSFGSGTPRSYVFYDDNRVVVAMYSNLHKNTITTTRYSLEHTDMHMLPIFSVQENIPVVNSTFEVVAPAYVNMSFVMKGNNTSWIKQTKEEKNGNVIYRFTATDVPSSKHYSHVPSENYYEPHIIPFITSYKLPDVGKTVHMLDDASGLYKYDFKYIRNINMQVDTPIIHKVEELTKNDLSEREKAAHIYQWVQKNIHYIAFEKGLEGFVPRAADTVYKRKYGDCKDMTSLLVTMCRKAGLDAHYATIGTRDLPYTHDETPTPILYNHMICAVHIGNDWIFLDATDPTLPFGRNHYSLQGKEAMIAIDAKNYKIEKIPVEPATNNITTDTTWLSLTDYKVSGKAAVHYKGYRAWGLHGYLENFLKKTDKDKAIRSITQRGSDKYLVSRYDVIAEDYGNRDMAINTDFTIDNYAGKVGKKYYINMNVNRVNENSGIYETDRKVDYYNDYKQKIKEVVVMDIPKGYHVESLPKNATGGKDGLWSYRITYETDAKKLKDVKRVTLIKEYTIDALAIGHDDFAANNNMVNDLKKLYKETVVLTAK